MPFFHHYFRRNLFSSHLLLVFLKTHINVGCFLLWCKIYWLMCFLPLTNCWKSFVFIIWILRIFMMARYILVRVIMIPIILIYIFLNLVESCFGFRLRKLVHNFIIFFTLFFTTSFIVKESFICYQHCLFPLLVGQVRGNWVKWNS